MDTDTNLSFCFLEHHFLYYMSPATTAAGYSFFDCVTIRFCTYTAGQFLGHWSGFWVRKRKISELFDTLLVLIV